MPERVDCNVCGADDHEVVYRHPVRPVSSGVCRRCGLAYLSPRPDAEEAARFYRAYQQAYPPAFLADPANPFARAAEERAEFAASWLGAGANVLELGCGPGHFLRAMRDRGHSVRGLDPSVPQVEFAQAQFSLSDVYVGDEATLPGEGGFDLVALFHVIEHLRDPVGALRRVAAALRPGGIAFLDMPNALRLPTDAIEHLYVSTGQHLYSFTPRTIERAAACAGLESLYVAHHPLPHVYDSNLRLVARRVGPSRPGPTPDPDESLACMRQYHQRLSALGSRVSAMIREASDAGRGVALYGAGFHTLGLLDLCNAADRIRLVVDDDERKHGGTIAGIPIRSPEALCEGGIADVVVSSLAAESELVARVRSLGAPGLRIHRVYGERVAAKRPTRVYRGAAAP